MIEAVREFLSLFEGAPLEPQERLRALARALDRLACAYHDTCTATDPGHYGKGESSDYKAARSIVIKYFPDFGFYPVISPLSDISSPPEMGDAVDDLADIRSELLEARRLLESGLASNAEAHFRSGYELHWGRHHLPGLRNYVSARIFEE